MLSEKGVFAAESEPLKLVLDLKRSELCCRNAVSSLRKANIVPEFYDESYIVFMFTPESSQESIERLYRALVSLDRGNDAPVADEPYRASEPVKSMSIRDAVFSEKELISVSDSEGRICASPTVSCPPAVPVVISGEIIGKNEIELMLSYGTDKIEVVK